jgi:hypothetical protein
MLFLQFLVINNFAGLCLSATKMHLAGQWATLSTVKESKIFSVADFSTRFLSSYHENI